VRGCGPRAGTPRLLRPPLRFASTQDVRIAHGGRVALANGRIERKLLKCNDEKLADAAL